MTSTSTEPRQYELERRELVEPRAFFTCSECDEPFHGPTAASLWIKHTVPMCPMVSARARIQREMEAERIRKQRVEDALINPLLDAFEVLGYQAMVEAIANVVEGIGGEENLERSRILFKAAEFGETR